ncbi:MAG: ribosome maturation factor RimM [Gammaproteobacteria bacterium]|nr:ribosome maturation factor RimM [Gammaproteobacteria bacterium]MDE0190683.1 ribosome maturation factor RimM [Gammaproteobacteria bacterium]
MPQDASTAGRLASTVDPDGVVLVGAVGAPFGVKGWAHVRSYTDPPGNLLDYGPWQLRREDGTNDPGWVPTEVEAKRHGGGLIARFAGVRNRDAAAELHGRDIGVSASVLPEPEQGEYYWRDLIGTEVVNKAGVHIGEVERLFATPAHDVLVVVDDVGERMIPFVNEWVVAVLPECGRVIVDWEADWR